MGASIIDTGKTKHFVLGYRDTALPLQIIQLIVSSGWGKRRNKQTSLKLLFRISDDSLNFSIICHKKILNIIKPLLFVYKYHLITFSYSYVIYLLLIHIMLTIGRKFISTCTLLRSCIRNIWKQLEVKTVDQVESYLFYEESKHITLCGQ